MPKGLPRDNIDPQLMQKAPQGAENSKETPETVIMTLTGLFCGCNNTNKGTSFQSIDRPKSED